MSMLNVYYLIPKKYETEISKGLMFCIKEFLKNFYKNGIWGSKNSCMDKIRTFSLLITFIVLKSLDPARLYHHMRVQSLMKMYVFFNFLDLCDKLVATIIEDIENLIIEKNEKDKHCVYSIQVIFLGFLYTFMILIHSLIMYVHLVSLHVCANSRTSNLYALLIGNNFVELRSAITKKYDNISLNSLFENDLLKRFQTFIFLVLILIYNTVENCDLKIKQIFFPLAVIWLSKIMVETLKHAFICRFNNIENVTYKIEVGPHKNYHLGLSIVSGCLFWNIFKYFGSYRWLFLALPLLKFMIF